MNPKAKLSDTNQPKALQKLTPLKKSKAKSTSGGKHSRSKPRVMSYTEPSSFLLPGGGGDWSVDDPDRPLTYQQWAFVGEYMIDFNAGAAMRRAGYTNITHSTRLMKTPNVRKAIATVLVERYTTCRATADKMLANLVRIIDASLGDFLDWDGTSIKLKPAHEIPPEKRSLIAELKQGKRGGWSIKLHDKLDAIEKAMRHLGMFDKSNHGQQASSHRKIEILQAVREGRLTVNEALLTLDIEGLPIPESLHILASRRKAEEMPSGDGNYSVVSPEEMAKRAARRLAKIERQRAEFVPQRQAEVQAIKDELGNRSFAPEINLDPKTGGAQKPRIARN